MKRPIKTLGNQGCIYFDTGKFDDWCVYVAINGSQPYAPRDSEYFSGMQTLAGIFGTKKVYADFLRIYEKTSKNLDADILNDIDRISADYGQYSESAGLWFTLIYAGMIAEENKAHAVLKKRIKHLAVYQLLIEKMPVDVVVNFSKGKAWRELDQLMKRRGI
ncbi:MAG: hypothetical protein Q7J34_00190 [Bacteroidales bacterium]|jgi:hypothetical protein|nr:hypothetical protein [Bacteroidales bacterium]